MEVGNNRGDSVHESEEPENSGRNILKSLSQERTWHFHEISSQGESGGKGEEQRKTKLQWQDGLGYLAPCSRGWCLPM